MTNPHGRYEAGAFDASGGELIETECARMIRALATTGTFAHEALAQPGWWHGRKRQRSAAAMVSRTFDSIDSIREPVQTEPLHLGLA